jgi:hypothetical protein
MYQSMMSRNQEETFEKVPFCLPELGSGSGNFLILLDAEPSSA